MSFVRWFNRTIEPLPVSLTLLAGGAVWVAFFVLAAWALCWIFLLPGLLFPGLR